MNDYLNIKDAKGFSFYKVPKVLFTEERYKNISTDAKMLYALLLDRMNLSLKNNWYDCKGRVYQYFTVNEAKELLSFGHDKICRLFKELENANLIERKRQGLGKASIIYLRSFI